MSELPDDTPPPARRRTARSGRRQRFVLPDDQHDERVDEVVAFTREAAAMRRTIVTEALAAKLPDWEWVAPEGGLSIWVRLPDADAVQFSRLAARHGVIVRPGPLASPDGGFRDHIRIAYGADPERLGEAVDRLAAAWAEYAPQARRFPRTSLAVSV